MSINHSFINTWFRKNVGEIPDQETLRAQIEKVEKLERELDTEQRELYILQDRCYAHKAVVSAFCKASLDPTLEETVQVMDGLEIIQEKLNGKAQPN